MFQSPDSLQIWADAQPTIKHSAPQMPPIRWRLLRNCCENICINLPMFLAPTWFPVILSIEVMPLMKFHSVIHVNKLFIRPVEKIKTAKNCTFSIRPSISRVFAYQYAETRVHHAKWPKTFLTDITPNANNILSIANYSAYRQKVFQSKTNLKCPRVAVAVCIEVKN